jgi:hypothetical protein
MCGKFAKFVEALEPYETHRARASVQAVCTSWKRSRRKMSSAVGTL